MSSNEDDFADRISIQKSEPKLTPPGYKIKVSVKQAILIAELVDSPVFKILKNIYAAQRKDHIARTLLNSGQDEGTLFYYKGMAAEVALFLTNMEAVKKALHADEEDEK